MITSLLSFFGSSVFGTLAGSLFAWLNKREERAEQKAKYDHDEAMAKLAHAQALELADKARAQVQTAGEQAVAQEEAAAFTASQISANQKPVNKWAELIWTAIRPLITVYLLVATSLIAYRLSGLVGGFKALPMETIIALYGEVISEIIALTSYAVGWWFGARGSSKRGQKIS